MPLSKTYRQIIASDINELLSRVNALSFQAKSQQRIHSRLLHALVRHEEQLKHEIHKRRAITEKYLTFMVQVCCIRTPMISFLLRETLLVRLCLHSTTCVHWYEFMPVTVCNFSLTSPRSRAREALVTAPRKTR